jgi:CBS domain-containing protein
MMKISKCMTRDVRIVTPANTLREAAQMMAEIDSGVLPVRDGDRLIGMVTDRDIAVRGVGEGLASDAPVERVMSREVLYCFDDQELEDVARNMADIKVRRLPVLNRDKRLVGIVSLADLSRREDPAVTAKAVSSISKPGGRHTQAVH